VNAPIPRLDLGPIAAAVECFSPEEPATEVDAAQFLADLIDLRGGVALAERLAALDGVDAAFDPAAAERVRERLATDLGEIEARLTDAFDNALKPRYRLPTAHRALTILTQADALKTRKGKALRSATRNLWAPVGEFVETQLKRARFALADLRVAVGEELRRMGPDAARLERLDAALEAATRHEVERLYRRIPSACEASFGAAFREAVLALPAEPASTDLAEGFSAWGWLPEEIEKARGLVAGVVRRERRRLEALVEAACAVAGAEDGREVA
jgi:hypothetical protein